MGECRDVGGVRAVMVMPGNHSSGKLWALAQRYPGRLGWIMSPKGWRTPRLPYALDNGAFTGFAPAAFRAMLAKARRQSAPMWVVVPDVVGDKDATMRSWQQWEPELRDDWTLAIAVQDGMTARDVPAEAEVVFVGGSTRWKWRTVRGWCADFPRVHVGRVNTERMLWMAHECGAESCDGTGWFRGSWRQFAGLLRYLEESTHGRRQMTMDAILDEPAPARRLEDAKR